MADEQQPTLGRIVIYREPTGNDVPAIITGVNEGPFLSLTAFPPISPPYTPAAVPQAPEPHPKSEEEQEIPGGTWRWPERV